MNSKKIGTQFEQEFCEYLAKHGWWAHFLSANSKGAQPFDIIAIKDDYVYAIDCKTCSTERFPFSRIEDNQRLAFDKIAQAGNVICGFAIKYNSNYYFIPYSQVLIRMFMGGKSIKFTEGHTYNASYRFEFNPD